MIKIILNIIKIKKNKKNINITIVKKMIQSIENCIMFVKKENLFVLKI